LYKWVASEKGRQEVIDQYGDVSEWDVSKVTDMSYLFAWRGNHSNENARQSFSSPRATRLGTKHGTVPDGRIDPYHVNIYRNFNEDISGWDVENVTNMSYMFSGCRTFNQDISEWNVSNVTNMSYMFYWNRAFNKDISKWGDKLGNVALIGGFDGMFQGSKRFDQSICTWIPLQNNCAVMRDVEEEIPTRQNGELDCIEPDVLKNMFAISLNMGGGITLDRSMCRRGDYKCVGATQTGVESVGGFSHGRINLKNITNKDALGPEQKPDDVLILRDCGEDPWGRPRV